MEKSLINTATSVNNEVANISTIRYFSLEINTLMPLITDDLSNVEDATYIQKAIKSVVTSKDLQRQKEWGLAV
jgi:hypothetical protein